MSFKFIEINNKEICLTEYIGKEKVVIVPKSIKDFRVIEIATFCFLDNDFVEIIMIPDSVKILNKCSFMGCNNLTNIKYKYLKRFKLKEILLDCESYKNLNNSTDNCFEYKVMSNKAILMGYRNKCVKELEIPEYVKSKEITEIRGEVFCNFKSLEQIKMSDKITYIEEKAFCDCYSLKSIKLSDNVTKLKQYTFYNCTSLENINLPKNLKIIEKYAFNNCTNLKEVVLPETLEVIKRGAFNKCRNLEKINIPDNMKKIEECSFFNCKSLKEIIIPENVEIETNAFFHCQNLKSVKIPIKFKPRIYDIFNLCASLSSITYY